MSYTPRTDAAEFHVDDDCSVQDGMVVSSEVSRKLEIELAEAIRAANYWKAEASRECTLAQRANKERDELRAEVERLKAENVTLRNAQMCCESCDETVTVGKLRELRADKSRLDWLDDNALHIILTKKRRILLNSSLIARPAIDAAMKGPRP